MGRGLRSPRRITHPPCALLHFKTEACLVEDICLLGTSQPCLPGSSSQGLMGDCVDGETLNNRNSTGEEQPSTCQPIHTFPGQQRRCHSGSRGQLVPAPGMSFGRPVGDFPALKDCPLVPLQVINEGCHHARNQQHLRGGRETRRQSLFRAPGTPHSSGEERVQKPPRVKEQDSFNLETERMAGECDPFFT